MDLDDIMLSEINQTETNTVWYLYGESKKTSKYYKKEAGLQI